MQEIKEWLKSGRSWSEGLVLISKYSKSKSIIGVLRQNGESPMTKRMMTEHLRKVAGQDQPKSADTSSLPSAHKKKQAHEPVNPTGGAEPVAVAELRKKANAHYAEMGVIHARLLPEPEQSVRKKLVEKFKVIQQAWAVMVDRLSAFDHTGVLPEEPVSKKKASLEALREAIITNLRSFGVKLRGLNVSKYLPIKRD